MHLQKLNTSVSDDGTEFYYITTEEQIRLINEMFKPSDRGALDTETCTQREWVGRGGSALDPHTAKDSLIILAKEGEPPAVIDSFILGQQELTPLLEKLLQMEYLILHNGKFDWQILMSNYGLNIRRLHCTMIMSQLLANATGSKYGRVRGHGYADVCRDFLDIHIGGKKDLRTSVWSIEPEARTTSNQWWLSKLGYGATDVLHLFELHDILEEVLVAPIPKSRLNPDGADVEAGEVFGVGMQECLEMEWRFTPLVARIEYTGAPVSREMLDAINLEIQTTLDESAVKLCRHFNLETVSGDIWEGGEVPTPKSLRSLRSPEQLKKFISQSVKMNKIDTTESHFLERLLDIIDQLSGSGPTEEDTDEATRPVIDFTSEEERDLFSELLELEESTLNHSNEIVRDVLLFKRMVKQVGMDLRKFINPKTGRIHFKLHQCGTSTGRLSSSSPNVQQIPARLYLKPQVNFSTLFLTSSGSEHIKNIG